MLERTLDNIANVLVCELVKDVLARPLICDEGALPQNLQLMRNGRLRHSEKLGNITHAKRASVNREHYPHSRRIGENLEKFREMQYLCLGRHILSSSVYSVAMKLVRLAKQRLFQIKILRFIS